MRQIAWWWSRQPCFVYYLKHQYQMQHKNRDAELYYHTDSHLQKEELEQQNQKQLYYFIRSEWTLTKSKKKKIYYEGERNKVNPI